MPRLWEVARLSFLPTPFFAVSSLCAYPSFFFTSCMAVLESLIRVVAPFDGATRAVVPLGLSDPDPELTPTPAPPKPSFGAIAGAQCSRHHGD